MPISLVALVAAHLVLFLSALGLVLLSRDAASVVLAVLVGANLARVVLAAVRP